MERSTRVDREIVSGVEEDDRSAATSPGRVDPQLRHALSL
jgi:hypothetical protein